MQVMVYVCHRMSACNPTSAAITVSFFAAVVINLVGILARGKDATRAILVAIIGNLVLNMMRGFVSCERRDKQRLHVKLSNGFAIRIHWGIFDGGNYPIHKDYPNHET